MSAALDTQQAADDYTNRLQTALLRLFEAEYVGEVAVERDTHDTLLRRGDRTIFVRARYRTEGALGVRDMDTVRTFYQGDVYSVSGGLLVSPRRMIFTARLVLGSDHNSSKHVQFVQWRGPMDDDALVEAVNRLLSEDDEPQPTRHKG